MKRDSANILYNKLINTGAFNQWTFEYADKNRQKLSVWKDFNDFDRSFRITTDLMADFLAYAKKAGVTARPDELQKSRTEIESLLKSLIARHVYDDQGFYPIYNKTDKTFLKALELVKK
jgi:carboxyl-terminal processing protease